MGEDLVRKKVNCLLSWLPRYLVFCCRYRAAPLSLLAPLCVALKPTMPTDSLEEYAKNQSLQPLFSMLLKSVCADLPSSLLPYLLHKLCEEYPTAATAVGVEPELKAWTPLAGKRVFTQADELQRYLDDLRWNPTANAIMESVMVARPSNVPQYMIALLKGGDLDGEVDDGSSAQYAASRVQAMQRGKKSRQSVAKLAKSSSRSSYEFVHKHVGDRKVS